MSVSEPDWQATLEELHARYRGLRDGRVADYIPELARADPDSFGVCIVTADGQVHAAGDCDRPLTLQSISKPFTFGMALEDHGRDEVLARVGVEATGDPFDSIIKLDTRTRRPHNPMVNAGAIATTSLLRGAGPTARLIRLLEGFRRYVGREVLIDTPVYVSERTTGHRNRAIAHLMLHVGMIDGSVEEALDLYFQQCSIRVTCRELALMAATLANGGVNPCTQERALDPRYLRDVLSVMFTSGLYDASGQWAYRVGLPAKSGVSGGLLAVVPGRLGIGICSPPLDERGNSVRALRVCEDLSRRLGLHAFDASLARAAPDRARLEATLAGVHRDALDLREGALASYIPALADVDPDAFAVALCTADGQTLVAGDHARRFTLQSVANPFCYGLALEHGGRDLVERFVNVEPSGNPFNAIALDPRTNRPSNPMINAGAIGVAALQPGADAGERLRRLLDRLARFAGRPLEVDARVFDSEWAAADRNRSIAYLMRNFGMLAGGDLDGALRLYMQSCSVLVDCRDLAIMAATLANGGVNPVTGAQALAPEHLRDVLSVMLTCGMNEYAGEWTYRVGLPAKSGVGGGVLAVVPGALGIAVFSPRLDARGNSVRGLRVCEALARGLGLHAFER